MDRHTLERCSCREIGDRLSEYLDEELGALDRARVVLHVSACPRCAATAAGLAEVVRAVRRSRGGPGRRAPCR